MCGWISAFALTVLGATGAVTMPDRATGSIGGRVALMFWPTSEQGPLDPTGCVVHVVADRGAGKESRYPCGQWLVPGPAGAYLVWLEHGDTMSASPTIVRYAAEPFSGLGSRSLHRMWPAGMISLGQLPADTHAATLRLFSVRDPGSSHFERKMPLAEVAAGVSVRMPAGRLIAALYDGHGEPVAVSRSVRVEPGKRSVISTWEPRSGGSVLFSLQRPWREYPEGTLTLGGKPPDVVHQVPERVVALWYRVPEGRSTLRFDGEGLPTKEIAVTVKQGNVAMIRERLTR
ncbi:MAG TPA: hypothetical protein VNI54_09405 [Thermoanaerobaculia bacterium]|nr:hypothetical protein [Thermoanaerobaculia bacterium]